MSWTNPQNPIDKMISEAFSKGVDFEILANKTIKDFKIPKTRKTKRKKWKKVTIYVVKRLKNGEAKIKPKIVKIPINQPNFQNYKPKKPKIWLPKTNRALFKPYFG